MAGDNKKLTNARSAKNDEWYTRLSCIEREMLHYKKHFKGKVVYCNCDDPRRSQFVRYFALNFEHLGLKMLRATGYNEGGRGSEFIYAGGVPATELQGWIERSTTDLLGDGSFDSPECKANLAKADIVVTNPPFSVFRDYVASLMSSRKKFLIVGPLLATGYKEVFPLIQEGKIWLGTQRLKAFDTPGGGQETAPALWFTNLSHKVRSEPIPLFKRIADGGYERYDNYDAINVDKTADIPRDYQGVMGVPVSFLEKHCPGQFRIVGQTASFDDAGGLKTCSENRHRGYISGEQMPARILIQATGA